jgi:hypothetical protein
VKPGFRTRVQRWLAFLFTKVTVRVRIRAGMIRVRVRVRVIVRVRVRVRAMVRVRVTVHSKASVRRVSCCVLRTKGQHKTSQHHDTKNQDNARMK